MTETMGSVIRDEHNTFQRLMRAGKSFEAGDVFSRYRSACEYEKNVYDGDNMNLEQIEWIRRAFISGWKAAKETHDD